MVWVRKELEPEGWRGRVWRREGRVRSGHSRKKGLEGFTGSSQVANEGPRR